MITLFFTSSCSETTAYPKVETGMQVLFGRLKDIVHYMYVFHLTMTFDLDVKACSDDTDDEVA